VIVLDTHALIWWVSGGPLSERARDAIARHVRTRSLYASSISVWEIATLVARGRLELTLDLVEWIARVEAIESLRFVTVDNRIAIASTRLPGELPRDPADRLIVATARSLECPLVTRDARLAAYPHVDTIW
jgi:PIN domain nuclease of toxin-antitoxin system